MRRLGTIKSMAERYDIPLEYIPQVHHDVPVFQNPRLRTAMGKARWLPNNAGRRIELHKNLARDMDKFRDTLAHEIAHIVAGRQMGHNFVWRAHAIRLGCNGEQYATAEEGEAIGIERKTKLVAVCEGCGVEIFKTKAYPRNRTYSHRGCGGNFRMIR